MRKEKKSYGEGGGVHRAVERRKGRERGTQTGGKGGLGRETRKHSLFPETIT
jgi:hypothetical protein